MSESHIYRYNHWAILRRYNAGILLNLYAILCVYVCAWEKKTKHLSQTTLVSVDLSNLNLVCHHIGNSGFVIRLSVSLYR